MQTMWFSFSFQFQFQTTVIPNSQAKKRRKKKASGMDYGKKAPKKKTDSSCQMRIEVQFFHAP